MNTIKVDLAPPVAAIQLNRPQVRNALSRTLMAAGRIVVCVLYVGTLLACSGHSTCYSTGRTAKSEGNGRDLFDGHSLQGWEGKEEWFRVEAGSIVAGSMARQIPQNEFLCTQEAFGDFELRLEVRLREGKGNAGVQFRTERIEGSHEVRGYQADMGEGWWGALYDESRRNRILAKPEDDGLENVLKTKEWNTYLIRAEGPRVQLWLNGTRTVDFVEDDDSVERTGHICLQIHSGPPSEAWYRNISIQPIDTTF